MLWNLPNALTVGRIAAVPVILALVAAPAPQAALWACAVFTLAAVTDWLDGFLARRLRQQSAFGRMLDPIADKLLVGAVLMALAAAGRLPALSLYPAIAILCREFLVSGLREHLAGRATLRVTPLAKWKTAAQLAALGLLLAGDAGGTALGLGRLRLGLGGGLLLWAAAALTLATGWAYLRAAMRLNAGCVPGGAGPL